MKAFYCLLATLIILAIGAFFIHYSEKNVTPRMQIVYQSMSDNDEYENDLAEALPEDRPIAN